MIIKRPPYLPDPLPLGYRLRKTRRGTVLDADLDLLGQIYDAFALVADARRPLSQIAAMLAEAGFRTAEGKAYSTKSLRAILHEPFYAGYVREEGNLVSTGAMPLIPKDVWRGVQRQMELDDAPSPMNR